jgi:hypothetical protein
VTKTTAIENPEKKFCPFQTAAKLFQWQAAAAGRRAYTINPTDTDGPAQDGLFQLEEYQ